MKCSVCGGRYFTLLKSSDGKVVSAYCVNCESEEGITYTPALVFSVDRIFRPSQDETKKRTGE